MGKKVIKTISVPGRLKDAICPPTEEIWKITSIVATGPSFDVSFGDRNTSTEPLTNYANLSSEIYIDKSSFIIFYNRANGTRLAFCCGEVVDP
jgi:hypothetical protein